MTATPPHVRRWYPEAFWVLGSAFISSFIVQRLLADLPCLVSIVRTRSSVDLRLILTTRPPQCLLVELLADLVFAKASELSPRTPEEALLSSPLASQPTGPSALRVATGFSHSSLSRCQGDFIPVRTSSGARET